HGHRHGPRAEGHRHAAVADRLDRRHRRRCGRARRGRGRRSRMTFVDGPVTVRVPATSANLGPGFDALGMALTWYDEVTAEVTGTQLVFDIEGEGADEVPRDETHLLYRAMEAAFDLLAERPGGLRLTCRNTIPHGRGLGSSAAVIAAGVVLARALVVGGEERMDDRTMFGLATDLEGHPDNVAPALFGG